MKSEITPISPAGFERLQRELMLLELTGYGPDDCARAALTNVGLSAKPRTFVVDCRLSGPVYPFEDWPQ